MIDWKEHINSDPNVLFGKPVIKNTGISVELILEKLAADESFEQILEAYPHLTGEVLLACISYAATQLKNEITINLNH